MEILGHRGWTARATENTAAAVRAALACGADGIEVDVRVTADGTAVCSHDATLRRVAGVHVRVDAATVDELSTVRLPCGSGLAVLAEVAALGTGSARLVLDLKSDPRPDLLVEAALAGLAAAGRRPQDVVLSSFDRVVDARLAALLGLSGVISDAPDVLRAGLPAAVAA